jgi:outer membrane protein OmpA-like peptidoglycan-associated protein
MRRRAMLALLPLLPLGGCTAGGAPPAVQPLRVVFFEDDSVALGGPATAVVAEAAREAVANPSLPVRVIGYIAPEPGQAPTVALARARAERVANELVRLGVARERVQVQGRGAVAFDLAPVESRRVEIRLGAT